MFIVCNKIDILKPEELDANTAEELQSLLSGGDVELLQTSCNTQEGVQDVKNAVCERLIAERVSQKLKAGTNSSGVVGGRLADVMGRIHVAQPMNGQTRETFIPEAIQALRKYDKNDPERRRLARDMEEENGGAGVFNVDLRADYILDNPEWKHDRIPEIFDGKNVYDYVDPDIEAKLQALEEEEERLEAEGYYDSDEEIDDAEEADVKSKAELIREKQALIRNEAKMRKSLKNQAMIPRKAQKKNLSELEEHLDVLGVDTTDLALRARSSTHEQRGRSMSRSRLGSETTDAMDIDDTPREKMRSKSRMASRARSQPATNRREDGVTDDLTRTNADRAAKIAQRKMNRMARQGEADRHVGTTMPKHLVSTLFFIFETTQADLLLSLLASVLWARRPDVERWNVEVHHCCSYAYEKRFHNGFPEPAFWRCHKIRVFARGLVTNLVVELYIPIKRMSMILCVVI